MFRYVFSPLFVSAFLIPVRSYNAGNTQRILFRFLFNIKIISYACGHNLSIEESLLLLTFTTLFMIIPAAPGMVGTFHASVIIVMTKLLEFSNQEASSFSIILHAYSYITYSIIGGFYFFKSNIRMNG